MTRSNKWNYPSAFEKLQTNANPLFLGGELGTNAEMEKAQAVVSQAISLFHQGAYFLRAHKEEFYPYDTDDLRSLDLGRMRVKYSGKLEKRIESGQAVMISRFKDSFRKDIEIQDGIFAFGIVDYVQPVESRLTNYEIKFSRFEQLPAIVSNSMLKMSAYVGLNYRNLNEIIARHTFGAPQINSLTDARVSQLYIRSWQSKASCQWLDSVSANFVLNTNQQHILDRNWKPAFDRFFRDEIEKRHPKLKMTG